MSEQETAVLDNPDIEAQEGEEQIEGAPDYSAMEQEKLVEELKKRDEEVEKSKKSYDEYRSMEDSRSNKLNERIAKLEGQLDATLQQQNARHEPKVDPNQFLKEMQDKIDEDPKNAANYITQMANEFNEVITEREAKLQALFEQKIAQQSPVYKDNKDLVDGLVKKGLSFDDALEFAGDLSKGKKVSQPATPTPPSTVEGGRVTATDNDVTPYEISKAEERIMRKSGLTDKDIAEIKKEMAQARAE